MCNECGQPIGGICDFEVEHVINIIEHKVVEYTFEGWKCTRGVKGYNNAELRMHFASMTNKL